MTKFQKKILKTAKKLENCLIVGKGFDFLEEFLEIFKTVFVVSDQIPNIRVKNLIFRSDSENLSQLHDITHIIIDRDQITDLEKYQPVWCKNNSLVIIEGDEPIGREFSKSLYISHWNCTSCQGFFHVWEKIK